MRRRRDIDRAVREGYFHDFVGGRPVLDEQALMAAEADYDRPGYYELHDERCGEPGWDCRERC